MTRTETNALDEVRASMAAEADAARGAPRFDVSSRFAEALENERARWFYWVPVLLGAGIWAYFALPAEPPLVLAALPLAIALVLRLALPRTTLPDILTSVLVIAAFGFALIAVRTAHVAAPILAQSLADVEVEGVVERIEPRVERGERITLRVLRIGELAETELPRRVRVRTTKRLAGLMPGDRVALRATLAAPSAPAYPGDYDFARHAYFQGLGAVGYALSPPRVLEEAQAARGLSDAWSLGIERLRQRIGERITAALPGETGGIAVALITGERGGISEATNDVYRASGLFHILSISGLHMAIMGGAVFWIVRLVLALFPSVALRFPIKKWAALAAVAGTLGYLAISGGSFATVRSFIMISIMFLAVLLDRPALALRNVVISALVILLVYPESLLDVGFQMSFAAVVALVAAYEAVRDRLAGDRREIGLVLRVALFFGGIVLTTLVASAAVAPFAAWHFHKSQQFAVLANLLAVPITNLVVMPAALATLIAMPLGLEAGPLVVMGLGIEAMTWTARLVGALPGAVLHLPAMPTAAFVLMLGGGLWLALWHARWRLLGLAAIIAGIALAPFGDRPDLLVGRDGRLVAVRADGIALDVIAAPRSRFEIERWLEADGDARSADDVVAATALRRAGLATRRDDDARPHVASAAAGSAETFEDGAAPAPSREATAHSANVASGRARVMPCDAIGCVATIKGTRVAVVLHPAAASDDCANADVVVLATRAPRGCSRPAAVIDSAAIRTSGSHAVYIEAPRRLRIETVAGWRGVRPWSPPSAPRKYRSRSPTPLPVPMPSVTPGEGLPTTATGASDEILHLRRPRVADFAQPALADALAIPRPEDEDDDPLVDAER